MHSRRFAAPVYFIIPLLLFWAGCAGPLYSPGIKPDMTPDRLVRLIRENTLRMKTFQGWGRLAAISTLGSFHGTLRILVKTPDSLWMKVEGPLGVDIAVGSFNRGRAMMYSPWENVVYHGEVHQIEFFKSLPFHIESAGLLYGMMGLPILEESIVDSISSFSFEEEHYIISVNQRDSIWIRAKGPAVARWKRMDKNGNEAWRWEAKSFFRKKGVCLPAVIQMTSEEPLQRISFVYESIKANRNLKTNWNYIPIPEGVETIEL